MSNSSPTQVTYTNLAHALAKFTSLTQIKALCYGFTGILLQDNAVILNNTAIKQGLANETLEHFAIFPISLDTQLWGAVMCDAQNVSSKRLALAKDYLTTIFQAAFADTTNQVQIWDSLTTEQVKQINYFHNFFPLAAQHDPLSTATATPATINGHAINNDDAYHSIKLAVAYIHKHIQQSLPTKKGHRHGWTTFRDDDPLLNLT